MSCPPASGLAALGLLMLLSFSKRFPELRSHLQRSHLQGRPPAVTSKDRIPG